LLEEAEEVLAEVVEASEGAEEVTEEEEEVLEVLEEVGVDHEASTEEEEDLEAEEEEDINKLYSFECIFFFSDIEIGKMKIFKGKKNLKNFLWRKKKMKKANMHFT